MKFEYQVKVLGRKGYRVSGDDHSNKLAEMVELSSNELGKEQWELISVFPSLMSGGAAAKLLATYKRTVK
ncbi:MAG: hypothetical protein HOK49_07700 [Opitutae bacterium]|jgi:hypothetical protein|nr:hypothetical protein [Opitutae bacterium]MBT5379520.1 hypothetical protein [Opitutae bacterium]MBT5691099.1 hypothetical protein [Opitutae bacterium]MBT6462407.1 hypothetical protein [Opitutae bacterium]MBT6957763.1 hypothetical protein [Opitutae bacterium]